MKARRRPRWLAHSCRSAPPRSAHVQLRPAATCAAGYERERPSASEGQGALHHGQPQLSASCALRESGSVVCFGAVLGGGSSPEEVQGPFRTVTAGRSPRLRDPHRRPPQLLGRQLRHADSSGKALPRPIGRRGRGRPLPASLLRRDHLTRRADRGRHPARRAHPRDGVLLWGWV